MGNFSTLKILTTLILFVLQIGFSRGDDFSDFFRDIQKVSIPDTNDIQSEYDFVIVGAGSTGSVVAHRLSEISNFTILLLEAGGEENLITEIPLMAAWAEITKFNWGYHAEPTENACQALRDGVCNWPKGRALGGTSVINFMIYVRGQKADFDYWSQLGNPGWSYKEMLPYFKKSEKVNIEELKNSPFHGTKGPLDVSHSSFDTQLADAFMKAGFSMGYNITDINSDAPLGFDRTQANLRRGRRCSAAKAFLQPIIDRKNLHISQHSWVTKILIDPNCKKAIGVEFLKNRRKHVVIARKEVILSAGAIGSPHLLMLSGIGPRENLESLNISVVKDLKVGHNLQDHMLSMGIIFPINESITIVEGETGTPLDFVKFFFGDGPLTSPAGAEGIAFMKVEGSQLPEHVPDIELILAGGSICGDFIGSLRNMVGISDEQFEALCEGVIGKHAFDVVPILQHPKSRGRISLKSTNPFHWPKMEGNYFQHPDDVETFIKGIKLAIKLVESKPFKKFDAKFITNSLPECKHIQFQTDEYWKCYIKNLASSIQHQVGTCKMGPSSDPDAVVDAKLKVHGIGKLRVVDVSIMPTITAGHPNAVAYAIGEKASDMIKAEWNF